MEDIFASSEHLLETKLEDWEERQKAVAGEVKPKYETYLNASYNTEDKRPHDKVKRELELVLYNKRHLFVPSNLQLSTFAFNANS